MEMSCVAGGLLQDTYVPLVWRTRELRLLRLAACWWAALLWGLGTTFGVGHSALPPGDSHISQQQHLDGRVVVGQMLDATTTMLGLEVQPSVAGEGGS